MDSIRREGGIDLLNPLRFLAGQRKISLADFIMEGLGLFFKTGFLMSFGKGRRDLFVQVRAAIRLI